MFHNKPVHCQVLRKLKWSLLLLPSSLTFTGKSLNTMTKQAKGKQQGKKLEEGSAVNQLIKWNTTKESWTNEITNDYDWQKATLWPFISTPFHSLIKKARTSCDVQSIHKNHSRVKSSSALLLRNQNAKVGHCYSIGKSLKTNPYSPHGRAAADPLGGSCSLESRNVSAFPDLLAWN